jgi:hypothetical protein
MIEAASKEMSRCLATVSLMMKSTHRGHKQSDFRLVRISKMRYHFPKEIVSQIAKKEFRCLAERSPDLPDCRVSPCLACKIERPAVRQSL